MKKIVVFISFALLGAGVWGVLVLSPNFVIHSRRIILASIIIGAYLLYFDADDPSAIWRGVLLLLTVIAIEVDPIQETLVFEKIPDFLALNFAALVLSIVVDTLWSTNRFLNAPVVACAVFVGLFIIRISDSQIMATVMVLFMYGAISSATYLIDRGMVIRAVIGGSTLVACAVSVHLLTVNQGVCGLTGARCVSDLSPYALALSLVLPVALVVFFAMEEWVE